VKVWLGLIRSDAQGEAGKHIEPTGAGYARIEAETGHAMIGQVFPMPQADWGWVNSVGVYRNEASDQPLVVLRLGATVPMHVPAGTIVDVDIDLSTPEFLDELEKALAT
jgi:hypothetical protein